MPATWLQYGVDALDAGYADPYNPVDAIFAAARYLRAAGAATDLRAAILAYNHSEEYVDSVLLRAKLISTYPKPVVATLTGLVDGRLPVTGKHDHVGLAAARRPHLTLERHGERRPRTTPPVAKPSTAASSVPAPVAGGRRGRGDGQAGGGRTHTGAGRTAERPERGGGGGAGRPRRRARKLSRSLAST